MRTYGRLLGKSVLLVAACVAVGFALLLAVFALPTEPMVENAVASADIFAKEEGYPTVNFLGGETMLDNFTDSIMLIQAAYREEGASLIDRTVNVYRPFGHGVSPVENFAQYLENGKPEGEAGSNYGRYWHGYLVALKPLLSLFTYGQIRTINAFWVAGLTLAVAFLMRMRGLKRYILPFVLAMLLIDPFAISMSLFYTSVYSVGMLAAIVFLWKRDWLCARMERLALLFVLAGCATSYVDLMTYPLFSYGIPITLCLLNAQGGWKDDLKLIVVTGIAWCVGYGGMWAGKWILGALLSGEDLGVLETIQLRSSTALTEGMSISYARLVARLLVRLRTPMFALAAVYVVAAGVGFLRRSPGEKLAGLTWLPYVVVCLLPFAWFLCMQNHSFIHPWFVYRELAICAFAGMCMLAWLSRKQAAAPAPRA